MDSLFCFRKRGVHLSVSSYFMTPLIHISQRDIDNINGVTLFSNSTPVLKHLDPVDYHSILFSTLYQSGVNYFEINIDQLPPVITDNEFWRSKIIPWNDTATQTAYQRALKVLEGKFNREIDNKYNVPQFRDMLDYLFKLFYSMETGTPFINPEYIRTEDFNKLEPRMDKNLLNCLKNLNTLTINEQVCTITPVYSILKKDVKRFEDIFHSKPYRHYSDLLQQAPLEQKFEALKKDINVSAIKLVNKYGNNLSIKETAFNFVKFTKKTVDLFVSKIPSTVGDFVIQATENISKEKKRIYFHEIDEAKFSTLLCKRIDEIQETGNFKSVVDELTKQKEAPLSDNTH